MEHYYDLATAAYELGIPKSRLYTMVKNYQIEYIQPNGKNNKIFIPEYAIKNMKIEAEKLIESEQDENYQKMLSRMGQIKRYK